MAKSFRTIKAHTILKISRKARIHVVDDVFAFGFDVGAVGKLWRPPEISEHSVVIDTSGMVVVVVTIDVWTSYNCYLSS